MKLDLVLLVVCMKHATGWKLEEALQLFFVGNDGGPTVAAPNSPPVETMNSQAIQNSNELEGLGIDNDGLDFGDEVRAPLPVVRETLYDYARIDSRWLNGVSFPSWFLYGTYNFREQRLIDLVSASTCCLMYQIRSCHKNQCANTCKYGTSSLWSLTDLALSWANN